MSLTESSPSAQVDHLPPDATKPGAWRLRAIAWGEAGVVAVGIALAVLWLWRFIPAAGTPYLKERVSASVLLPVALAMLLIVWLAPTHAALDPRTRRAWRWIALATAVWWVSGAIWVWLGRPMLSVADAVQMAFFPLVLLGVLSFPSEPLDRAARQQFALDSGVVVLSGCAGVWYFALWPSIDEGSISIASGVVKALYPVGDLLLLFAASAVLMRRSFPVSRRAMAWVAAGLIVRFVGDLAYGWESVGRGYQQGGLTDLTRLSACWALAVGACVQRRSGRRAAAARPTDATEGLGFSLFPYVSVTVVYGFLLATAPTAWGARVGGVLVSAVAVTALVLVRQFLATRENVRLQSERTARESQARFSSLVQNMSDVIVVVDERGVVQFASPSVTRVLGHEVADVVGRPLVELMHPDDEAQARATLEQAARAHGASGLILVRVRRADGEWRSMECVGSNLTADPAVRGIVVTARDVTERAALQAQLAHQAFHDPLTNLANRMLFRDRVQHAVALDGRRQEGVAVLFLDLDDFKTVNDAAGHAAGDRLLLAVAQRLLNATRGCDTVARLGGDEFAVLLESTRSDHDAIVVAERIVRSLSAPVPLDGGEVHVGVSVGIARSHAGESADELLRNADVAMYKAKYRGKNRYEIFAPEMHAALLDRLELEADLRRALSGTTCDEFRIVYQPIVELAEARVIGFEALVRWHHPRRGVVSPASFIPIAEETGLIVPLGSWVLRQACAQGAIWHRERAARDAAAAPLTLTVNLSGRQLRYPEVASDVAAALAESGLPPACLVLEITESVIMEDTSANLATLHTLKSLGVRLAVDDFGTGYSSLGYLQRFPIDILKIDKTFVDAVGRGASNAALARTIVALGDSLSLRCVAEGIEKDEQRQHLRAIGCAYGQGYLFAKPMGAEAAAEFALGEKSALAAA